MSRALFLFAAVNFLFFAVPATAAEDRDMLVVSRVAPVYPLAETGGCLEGEVLLEFTVTVRGDVEDVTVIRSDHGGVFDAVAIEAVKKWRFKPRIENGEAVEQRARLPFRFEKAEACKEAFSPDQQTGNQDGAFD